MRLVQCLLHIRIRNINVIIALVFDALDEGLSGQILVFGVRLGGHLDLWRGLGFCCSFFWHGFGWHRLSFALSKACRFCTVRAIVIWFSLVIGRISRIGCRLSTALPIYLFLVWLEY